VAEKSLKNRPWERLSEAEEYDALCRARLEHPVEVREPLVLISQIQRSGGTLLSQLFDGHPECHAHPQQLHIGYPGSRDWPPLEPAEPERCFSMLFEKKAATHLRIGYRKSGVAQNEVFPFCFLPRLQHGIFLKCMSARPAERERDVLDCYFTSYFNAWLDNHNLYTGPKKLVTGFAPRLSEKVDNVDRFQAAYPDGVLISLVRDPRAWYLSMREAGLDAKWPDVETAVAAWRKSAAAAIQAHERSPDCVLLLTYEQLVGETERTMARVAERLGIEPSPMLVTPTFNGRPILANSSFPVGRYGILTKRVSGYRDVLDAETIARIEDLAGDLYERAAALSSCSPPARSSASADTADGALRSETSLQRAR
jgi:Sulfotransferase family